MIRTYYLLTKPGIIMGNLITTAAGFALASKGHLDFWLFLATLIGLACTIASACVFNNYIDRDLDEKMERTKNRPLVRRLITGKSAIIFAIVLGFLGTLVLSLFTNPLTVWVTLAGFFIYVVLYYICKCRSLYGTFVGSISGAVPPVIGYVAVSNQLDAAALILFMITFLWQMPHFFAIAIYRLEDYAAASIPVLPVSKGIFITKQYMLIYTLAFIGAALMPTLYGYTGYPYLIITTLVGVAWLLLCLNGFQRSDDKLWARHMFLLSLVVITALCIMLSVDVIIPSDATLAHL